MRAKRLLCSFVGVLLYAAAAFSQTGELRGRVIDAATREPLSGVNVILKDTHRGAATDANGEYRIPGVEVGIYTLVFSMIGYEPRIKTDVLVRSNKVTYVSAELEFQAIQAGQEVVVTASSYFPDNREAPVSVRSLNYEEVRRSPGAREDVSRMIQNLPGVSPSTDDRNDLIVRGGSPSEVLFLIDNIEIPNPNHFGTQGATGGPISMINNEFIEEVVFMAGGFPAKYGDKLSAALNIRFREGLKERLYSKFDINFAGAGGIFEGGFAGGKGSWLVSGHRSYLDFMESLLNIGGIPIYSNFQSKVTYRFSPALKLSILGIGGIDRIEIQPEPDWQDYEEGEADTSDIQHIINKTTQYTIGMNLMKLWSRRLYSTFTLSHSYNRFFIDFNRRLHAISRPSGGKELTLTLLPNGHRDVYDNTSVEQVSQFKSEWTYIFDSKDELSFGFSAKLLRFKHDIVFQPYDSLNMVGTEAEGSVVRRQQSPTPKLAFFTNLSKRLSSRLRFNLGFRYDYFQLLQTHDLAPRFSFRFRITDNLTLKGAAGRYYQSPELVYISGHPANVRQLKSIRGDHWIAGMDYMIAEGLLFSMELYRKTYHGYPVSNDPDFAFFTTANLGGSYGSVGGSGELVSEGRGRAQGLEVLLQKKLISGLYGLISLSLSKVEHQAKDGVWRPGEFDNRVIANILLGYRVNKSLEFSIKWRYDGGRPYTPFNVPASMASGRDILDVTRINGKRFAPYHRLDVRYDYRKYFKKFTLVTYFSIENVYNRKNQGLIFWNRKKGKSQFSYQTGFFPVGGISIEF